MRTSDSELQSQTHFIPLGDIVNESPSPFPRQLSSAVWFGFFNAVSFQIFLGAPLVLYAKSLGASSTQLGLLAAIASVLLCLQLPAARFFSRFGFRKVILAGWTPRVVCIFLASALPIIPWLSDASKLAALFALQFVFNVLRGASSGAWLPWITELLPAESRSSYLSRERRLIFTGCLLSMVFCALVLKKDSSPLEFSLAFLLSAVGGAFSLFFLNRVPDAPPSESLRQSGTPVPWRAIATFPPFARLMGFHFLFSFTYASLGIFTVSFLKGRAGMGENQTLLFIAASFLASILVLPQVGRWLDAYGLKQPTRWLVAVHAAFVLGWLGMASGVIPPTWPVILAIYAVMGMAVAAWSVVATRLQMEVIPTMGRSHFFAFFTVVICICEGLSPVFWGLCLDALNNLHMPVGPGGVFEWNRYSVYFAALLVLSGAVLLATKLIVEKSPTASEVSEAERKIPHSASSLR